MAQNNPENHQKIDSSSIDSIGYDPKTLDLHVDFHKTGRYIYENIPPQVYEEIMMSSSKGKTFFEKVVKPKYNYRRG